jgi:hypothetical protein
MAISDSTQPTTPKQFCTALDVATHAGYRLDELTALFCAIKELAEPDTFARNLASLGMDLADRSSVELSDIGERLQRDYAPTPAA